MNHASLQKSVVFCRLPKIYRKDFTSGKSMHLWIPIVCKVRNLMKTAFLGRAISRCESLHKRRIGAHLVL